jgi:hypothetical protein
MNMNMNMKNCVADESYVTVIFIHGIIVVPKLAAMIYLNIAILKFRAIFNCNTTLVAIRLQYLLHAIIGN